MCCSSLHRFEYPDKSGLVDYADRVLTAPRHLFDGRTIKCHRLGEETATFVESRPYGGNFFNALVKTAAAAGTILASPLIIPALIVKKSDHRQKEISKRYCRRSPKDNFWKDHLLSNDLITRLTAKIIMKTTGLDSLALSMQIHGNKILRKIAPWRYEGGHPLPIIEIMLKKISSISNNADPEISRVSEKAKSALESMYEMSKKMAPITLSNIFSIKHLFNSDKRIKALASDVADDLIHMDIDGAFMIPLNFYTPTQGFRNITTTFKRLGEDEYEWHIFRADIGDEGEFIWTERDEISEIIVTGLTRDQIQDKYFLRKILAYGTVRKQDQGDKFFKFLKKYEAVQDNVSIIAGSTRKKSPLSDIFTLKSLNFALKELMGESAYKKFMFLLKLADLSELKEKLEKGLIEGAKEKKDVERLLPYAQEKLVKRYHSLLQRNSNQNLNGFLNNKQTAFIKTLN